MFFLEKLPDDKTMQDFAVRFPEMQIETTSTCLKLFKSASTIIRKLEQHFSKHNLSVARFLALVVLERTLEKQLMPVEIARQMGISKQNTTRLLNTLKEDKLVICSDHESDGRATTIKITSKGSKTLTIVLPGYYKILNKSLSNFSKKSKLQLSTLLEQINLDL